MRKTISSEYLHTPAALRRSWESDSTFDTAANGTIGDDDQLPDLQLQYRDAIAQHFLLWLERRYVFCGCNGQSTQTEKGDLYAPVLVSRSSNHEHWNQISRAPLASPLPHEQLQEACDVGDTAHACSTTPSKVCSVHAAVKAKYRASHAEAEKEKARLRTRRRVAVSPRLNSRLTRLAAGCASNGSRPRRSGTRKAKPTPSLWRANARNYIRLQSSKTFASSVTKVKIMSLEADPHNSNGVTELEEFLGGDPGVEDLPAYDGDHVEYLYRRLEVSQVARTVGRLWGFCGGEDSRRIR
ncbi:hypothetical protein B0H13DRAFT_1854950 [Mycena leptocephala]|nr:hypothetical protein B0H13DRAFT_1854950 [Mycena leptocephala]